MSIWLVEAPISCSILGFDDEDADAAASSTTGKFNVDDDMVLSCLTPIAPTLAKLKLPPSVAVFPLVKLENVERPLSHNGVLAAAEAGRSDASNFARSRRFRSSASCAS